MTNEQLEKLYQEAREASALRLAAEKKEKARLRSVASAERYCKLYELRLKEKQLQRKKKEQERAEIAHLQKVRKNLRLALDTFIEWRQQLEERCDEIIQNNLEAWRLLLDTKTIERIDTEIPKYEKWLAETEAEILEKSVRR